MDGPIFSPTPEYKFVVILTDMQNLKHFFGLFLSWSLKISGKYLVPENNLFPSIYIPPTRCDQLGSCKKKIS